MGFQIEIFIRLLEIWVWNLEEFLIRFKNHPNVKETFGVSFLKRYCRNYTKNIVNDIVKVYGDR